MRSLRQQPELIFHCPKTLFPLLAFHTPWQRVPSGTVELIDGRSTVHARTGSGDTSFGVLYICGSKSRQLGEVR
jgi:hypothetical protein